MPVLILVVVVVIVWIAAGQLVLEYFPNLPGPVLVFIVIFSVVKAVQMSRARAVNKQTEPEPEVEEDKENTSTL